MKAALSVSEAADISNVSTATMRRWAQSGKNGVVAEKVGRDWIIHGSSIPIGKPTVRDRILELIESYEDAHWQDQVPYLVRTEVVRDLRQLLDDFFEEPSDGL